MFCITSGFIDGCIPHLAFLFPAKKVGVSLHLRKSAENTLFKEKGNEIFPSFSPLLFQCPLPSLLEMNAESVLIVFGRSF
ncbi:hypothetical protein CEXT_516881 [Caerostris extrusa]|uniref:Uncharacterized protein n=1 Tax=Caerostris extrusa TaxID=172846 RepID=A0AAV4MRX1_CAEEX|nr:hypothetical protein CEXT_516881 [Caerostris extrusa]